jgi:hypothetical protein
VSDDNNDDDNDEDYGDEDYGDNKYCMLGFVPGDAEPVVGREICEYGGWYISVAPLHSRSILSSSAFEPLHESGYVKAATIPPVPLNSAVEFTVDYTAHVAFYAPANARDFTAPPDGEVELCFVSREKNGSIPARSDPTQGTCVTLYPAVAMRRDAGTVRFA